MRRWAGTHPAEQVCGGDAENQLLAKNAAGFFPICNLFFLCGGGFFLIQTSMGDRVD